MIPSALADYFKEQTMVAKVATESQLAVGIEPEPPFPTIPPRVQGQLQYVPQHQGAASAAGGVPPPTQQQQQQQQQPGAAAPAAKGSLFKRLSRKKSSLEQQVSPDEIARGGGADDESGWNLRIIDTVLQMGNPEGTTKKEKKEYVMYIVQCSQKTMFGQKDIEPWQVHRRYSEFRQLHQDLCKASTLAKGIKTAPKRALKNSTSKDFVAKRREKLQLYLDSLEAIGELAVSPITMKFLGAKVHHHGL
eukprot:gene27690-17083_t